jgi:hypothetical protein
MNISSEPTMIGLSERCHALLKRLKEEQHFAEMADAYRFGIALAVAHGVWPEEPPAPRTTIFSVGTIDPEREIARMIGLLHPNQELPVYKWIERLAEWGVTELWHRASNGTFDLGQLVDELVE